MSCVPKQSQIALPAETITRFSSLRTIGLAAPKGFASTITRNSEGYICRVSSKPHIDVFKKLPRIIPCDAQVHEQSVASFETFWGPMNFMRISRRAISVSMG